IKNATSILDYVFRELAVSYLGRSDLGHVDPKEMAFDAMGDGADEGKAPVPASAVVSPGYTRNAQMGNLYLVRGGAAAVARADVAEAVAAPAMREQTVKAEVMAAGALMRAGNGETYAAVAAGSLSVSSGGGGSGGISRAAEARMKGYEGEACGECGNFTMVRNGTCLKCDTCGGTSGCS
ncbi:MAG: ribonucleotide-diphosphate reductase subunit alpha, partial [Alphaproteobacteria bacterium HGW-Alphaproteobacteria-11]